MSGKHLITSLLILSLVVCLGACSEAYQFQWSEFEWFPWSSTEDTFDKGALMLPIQVDGYTDKLYLQLDTAIWQSCLFGLSMTQLPRESYRATGQGAVSVQASLAGRPMESWPFAVKKGYGGPLEESKIIGCLGLDFLKGKVLVLDLPNNRLALVNSTRQLPDRLAQAVNYLPAQVKTGRFIVKVNVGEQELRALYDTGSSIFTLVVSQPTWRELTGRRGHESDNTLLKAPSWGRNLEMIGAQAPSALKFAGLTISDPPIFYVGGGAFDPLFDDCNIDAIMGNAPFYDDYIVVLDCRGSRFGLAPAAAID